MNLNLFIAGLFVALFTSAATAQTAPKSINGLENDYNQYYLDSRESIYIHLSKSKLLANEDLWFATYIYDLKDHKPAIVSTNLNVQLFDINGNQILSKTFYSFQGKAHGHLNINSLNLSSGTYFIKASTDYIRTKDEDLSGLKSFEILGENNTVKTNPNSQDYDLQLLPEGGHVVAGVKNTIGVKLSNPSGVNLGQLPGFVIKGQDTISRFKTNRFGMASFTFQPQLDISYTVAIKTSSNHEAKSVLSNFDERGINMTAKDFGDEILLSLKSNSNIEKNISEKKFYAAIHQEGKIKDFSFYFPAKQNEANIKFPKDSLFNGVNTITIFNESFQPLLERLVFKQPNQISDVKVSGIKNFGDSLKIRISKPNIKDEVSYLSIATLPAKTKAYNTDANILSTFLLSPYLKGNIQNPSYYFSDEESERRRMYDLDLLLLTQGWSKYSWTDIFSDIPSEKITRTQGFSIQGEVFKRNTKKENDLFLRNESSGEFGIINIKDGNKFEVSNLFIEDSTKFSIGLLNDRNSELSKPSVQFQVFPEVLHSRLNRDDLKIESILEENHQIEIPENFVSTAQVLDTVTINGRTKEKKKDLKSGNRLSALAEEFIIDEEAERSYLYITDLIARNGFNVIRTPASVEIRSKVPFSLNALPPQPIIYLNGSRLIGDLSILYTITTDQVESVYINTSASAGRGLNSGGGVIEINLKKGASTRNSQDTINSIIANNGFEAQKQYYNPKYNSYSASIFQEYGIIDWKPEVNLSNGFTDIMILNTLQKKIKLYIEGFTSNGKLISKIIEVDTK